MKATDILQLLHRMAESETELVFADTTEYDYAEDKIYMNLDGEPDMGFMRHLLTYHCNPQERKWAVKIDEILWSLLHEIGHEMTMDFVEEDEKDETTRALCAMTSLEEVKGNIPLQDLYFNLPLEWEATDWAVCWAATHKEFLFFLSECLQIVD